MRCTVHSYYCRIVSITVRGVRYKINYFLFLLIHIDTQRKLKRKEKKRKGKRNVYSGIKLSTVLLLFDNVPFYTVNEILKCRGEFSSLSCRLPPHWTLEDRAHVPCLVAILDIHSKAHPDDIYLDYMVRKHVKHYTIRYVQ